MAVPGISASIPATLAGMTSTGADWIVTMDEDGQQTIPEVHPHDCSTPLWTSSVSLVYANAGEPSLPHGFIRNTASRNGQVAVRQRFSPKAMPSTFQQLSTRPGRARTKRRRLLPAPGVYLDVALELDHRQGGATDPAFETRAKASGRRDTRRGRLLSHFWRLVISSGTTPAARWPVVLGCR